MSAPVIALCTLAQVKADRRITTNEHDDRIREVLIPETLTRFNKRLGREFMPWSTATREFEVTGYKVELFGCDLRAATTVTLHPELGDAALVLQEGTDYELAIDRLTNTAGMIRLSYHLNLCSARAGSFGHAALSVAGDWGIWESVEDVDPDVTKAAILMVASAIEKPVVDLPGIDVLTPREFQTARGAGWDIPIDAYRKIQIYDRNLGVS